MLIKKAKCCVSSLNKQFWNLQCTTIHYIRLNTNITVTKHCVVKIHRRKPCRDTNGLILLELIQSPSILQLKLNILDSFPINPELKMEDWATGSQTNCIPDPCGGPRDTVNKRFCNMSPQTDQYMLYEVRAVTAPRETHFTPQSHRPKGGRGCEVAGQISKPKQTRLQSGKLWRRKKKKFL